MKTIMMVRHTSAIGLLNSENPPSRLRVLQAGTYVYTEELAGRLVYDIMGRPWPTTAEQILRIETLTGVTGWLFSNELLELSPLEQLAVTSMEHTNDQKVCS